ncbi:uncharacterized protein [Ambystoma mexicanum]|uniref:uncharacterized protein n=1 Tax=Ambystoma mexicanum TaxID=8296 RepID=UPI0037E77C55
MADSEVSLDETILEDPDDDSPVELLNDTPTYVQQFSDQTMNEFEAIDALDLERMELDRDDVFEGPSSDVCSRPNRPAPGRRGTGVLTGPGPRRLLSGRRKKSVGDAWAEQETQSKMKDHWIMRKRQVEVDVMKHEYSKAEETKINTRKGIHNYVFNERELERGEALRTCNQECTELWRQIGEITDDNMLYREHIQNFQSEYDGMVAENRKENNKLKNIIQSLKAENRQKILEIADAMNKIKDQVQAARTEIIKTKALHRVEKDSQGRAKAITKIQEEVIAGRQKVVELKAKAQTLKNSIDTASEDVKQSTDEKSKLKEQLQRIEKDKEMTLVRLDGLANEKAIKQVMVNLSGISEKVSGQFTVCEEILKKGQQLVDVRNETLTLSSRLYFGAPTRRVDRSVNLARSGRVSMLA